VADSTAGEPATPARPPVTSSTDEWLARISDQLEELNSHNRPAKASAAAAKKGTSAGKNRAEVRGN
jgi:hypothetical protein